jgi:hypothetical protein
MAGKPPALTYPQLRRIDAWFAERKISVAVMCRILRIAPNTLYDAAKRRRAYASCPRG